MLSNYHKLAPFCRNHQLFLFLITGERPKTWEAMPTDPTTGKESTLHVADLQPTSTEYLDVKKKFEATMVPAQQSVNPSVAGLQGSSGTMYNSILKIERIQNPTLYFQYVARKKEVDKRYPNGKPDSDRRLFHGTSADTCPKINSWGFNRSYAGKNGEQ